MAFFLFFPLFFFFGVRRCAFPACVPAPRSLRGIPPRPAAVGFSFVVSLCFFALCCCFSSCFLLLGVVFRMRLWYSGGVFWGFPFFLFAGGVSWFLLCLFRFVLVSLLVSGGVPLLVLLCWLVACLGLLARLLVRSLVRVCVLGSLLVPPLLLLPVRGRLVAGLRVLCVWLAGCLLCPCLVCGRLLFWWLRVSGVVAFAGSRSLGAAFAPLVGSAVGSVLRSGRSVSVGCCVGADAAVLSALCAASPRSGSCFAAFGSGGVGSCALSAVGAVSSFAAAGGSVSWWAGGAASVALPARLSARTGAVVAAASVSAVLFFSSPASVGSLLAARLAAERGLPVFAFPCGFCGSLLPSLGAGSWVCVGGSGVWSLSFRWVSSQVFLF